jgi:hypothetical protein
MLRPWNPPARFCGINTFSLKEILERRIIMVFNNQAIQYRITLDTEANIFIVFDANNENISAQGNTIEEAKNNLNQLVKE